MKTSKKSLAKTYKKIHKWPGLIIAFVLLYYSISGIIMNHREWFSGIDVSRKILPENFQYHNWNNGALKGNLTINADSILVFGNIGVWVTDSTFEDYRSFNAGFPKGVDNRKIYDLHIKRFVAIESVGDTIYALNRSYLFKGESHGTHTRFQKIELQAPFNYRDEVSLFQTLWQIHSGEIFGLPGKLFVDLLGIVTGFLSLTGIIYFLFPGWIKKRRQKSKEVRRLKRLNRWSLKWHNLLGAWTFSGLIILFLSGMFLRPPLLIAIAKTRIAPVKYTHLQQPNPWYDKLRDLLYDESQEIFLLSTSKGMYRMTAEDLRPLPFKIQPPISVMGINVFEKHEGGAYMVGSFSGLFLWNPSYTRIYNYAQGSIYHGQSSGRPVGQFKTTGLISDLEGHQYMIDYDKGALPLYHHKAFPAMPANVLAESKMSLWSLSLEIHTGRIFQSWIANAYILIVPLSGLLAILVVLSGYLLWRKQYKKK